MKAGCLYAFHGPINMAEIPTPDPKEGEVLVRIKACAISSGDMNTIFGKRKSYYGEEFKFPHVPGYQGAGIVEYIARDVHGLEKDQRVVVNGLISCGVCEYCKAGMDNLCPEHKLIGIDSGTQGCFAEYISVPARNLFQLSEHVPFERAAMISEVGTIYHGYVKRMPDRSNGFSVAIFGCGKMGPITVAVSRALGANLIFSIDRHPDRLRFGKSAGADITINSTEEDPVETIRHITGSKGVNVAIEMTGSEEMIVNAIRSVTINGAVLLIGIQAPVVLQLPTYYRDVLLKEVSIFGCLGKNTNEFRMATQLVTSRKLDLARIPMKIIPFDQITEALKMAIETPSPERIVLTM